MKAKDIQEFVLYLRNCTDRQVQGVYDKEREAGRDEYALMAFVEMEKRGIA